MATPIVPAPNHSEAIIINNGNAKTNNATVDLILSAENAIEMLISNDIDFLTASWQSFCTAVDYTIDISGVYADNIKTIYVKFRNIDGESEVFSASIELDMNSPIIGTIPILINNGSLRTVSRYVTLSLSAENATDIEVLNEDQVVLFQGIEKSYSEQVSWTLSEGNGKKVVYIKFMDDLRNSTTFYSATIYLEDQELSGNLEITEPETNLYTTDKFINVRGRADAGSIVQIDVDTGE